MAFDEERLLFDFDKLRFEFFEVSLASGGELALFLFSHGAKDIFQQDRRDITARRDEKRFDWRRGSIGAKFLRITFETCGTDFIVC